MVFQIRHLHDVLHVVLSQMAAYIPIHNVVEGGKKRTLGQWKNSMEELLMDIKFLQRPAVVVSSAADVPPLSDIVAPNRCLLDGFHALKRIRLALKCAEKNRKSRR